MPSSRVVMTLGHALRWAGLLLCLGSGPFLFIMAVASVFIMPSDRQYWVRFSIPFSAGLVLFVVGSVWAGKRLL